MKRSLKLFVFVILCTVQFSCKNDDANSNAENNSLVGEWLRSDSTETIQYKLVFTNHLWGSENKKFGLVINSEITSGGETISNAIGFEWEIVNDLLVITDSNLASTTFEFLSESEVLLNDISEFAFHKIGTGENY